MAHVNGDSIPSSHDNRSDDLADLDSGANKRKRDHDIQPALSDSRTKLLQRDMLDLLQRHDTEPSFLKHPFTSTQSSQKKARLSEPSTSTSTIAANLSTASYASLQSIKADVATVSEELVSSLRKTSRDKDAGEFSLEDLKHIRRIQMLESLVNDMVDNESQRISLDEQQDGKVKNEEGDSAKRTASQRDRPRKLGTVLTLFGNAPTPKQLFSSMQNPLSGAISHPLASELPVEELSLPNGITATKVMPVVADDKKGPTFEERFAAPHDLSAQQPPKAHKRSSTRDKDLTWEFKDPIQRDRKAGFTVQPLTVGSWLGYGGSEVADASSTREKRKERTRALSSGGETAERPKTATAEDTVAKEEEALFRRAFSSFAPTCDNSTSVIPAETRNLVWWHKIGNKRYNDIFAIDPALLDESEETRPPPLPSEDHFHDENFETVMDDLEELESFKPEAELVKSKTEVGQVLRDISELLETLASHQRIRNASLPPSGSASRTPISPATTTALKSSKPDEPSEEEVSTFDSLQRELAYLILKLPPYAVAKLNGDQMEDLGVSKFIPFEAKDTKGVMEEDLVTRQAKMAALATASSIAGLARPNSSAGQHYNTTANRTPAIGQAANTRYGQQYSSRTPATAPQYPRQLSNTHSYGTPTATAPRPGFGQPNQWTRPGASQSSYGQQSHQQLYQRSQQSPSGGFGGFNQYQQTHQTQQRYPPAQQYQPQRTVSQAAAANAVNYQTQVYNRTTSPAKGFPAVPMAPTPQQRPVYQAQPQHQPGSGRATPNNNYPSQPHTPVNGFQPPSRPPQGIAPRPASLTPQPPPTQGAIPVQPNGTS